MFTIADYDKRYRPYDKAGRELVNPSFVKLPINPKGDGLRTLLKHKRGGEVFCIWCLLLEKTTAEKQPENRGKLLNHKGEPASVAEIAEGISHDRRIPLVKYALSVLASMGWVKCGQDEDIASTEYVPNIRVLKSTKDKDKGFVFPEKLNTPEFKVAWTDWLKYRTEIRKKMTPLTVNKQLSKLAEYSVAEAIAAINKSIQNSWQGLFPEKLPASSTTPSSLPIQSAICFSCHEPYYRMRYGKNGKPVFLCRDCDKALICIIGKDSTARLTLAEIEIKIGEGKARLADAERSTPKSKNKELVAADKKQVAIGKLVKETADNLGRG